MQITILGAGSFGTAIARHISTLSGGAHQIRLWCARPEQAAAIERTRRNPDYLPNVVLEENVSAFGGADRLAECLAFTDIVLAVPAQAVAEVLTRVASIAGTGAGYTVVNLAKGIDIRSGRPIHRLAVDILPAASYLALSGPSHAEEVGRGLPTALVAASASEETALRWQGLLNDDRLRVYTSEDVLGVEIGGAMKNVMAIAVGVARASGFGDNSVAALVTRGLAEIMRYGAFLGANPLTLAGLAGIGDLMATCYSNLSRNLRFGMLVGQGESATAAAAKIGQVVEGMHTARALVDRARAEGIELPLSEGIYRVLYGGASVREVMTELLFRDPKPELPKEKPAPN